VDEAAFAAAIRDGRIAVAALDVRDPEPPAMGDTLAALPNVIATPHIAASSTEAVQELHRQAAQICLELLRDAGRLPAVAPSVRA
jgi:D-3-phosphoglycerate dehydrogenase